MIRSLGFLTGSALTVGAILLVTGPPQFREKLIAANKPSPNTIPAVIPLEIEPSPIATPATNPLEIEPSPNAVPNAIPLETELAPAIAPSAPYPQPMPEEQRWYSFWNPFRSEIAANGFAARLRTVTGIDYRVVRLEPGRYQVAFAYVDDAERRSNISLIETATGLSLPGESR